jgi:iron complex outermembrane receptor protein
VVVGGLIIIEPFRLKDTLLENYSKSSVKWQRRFHELKSTQGNDKGWSWNALGTVKYMGDKEPDYVLSNSGNRLTFLAI